MMNRLLALVLALALCLFALPAFAAAEIQAKTVVVQQNTVPDDTADDNDERHTLYLQRELFHQEGISVFGTAARARLNDTQKAWYDMLKAGAEQIAAGTRDSAVFEVTHTFTAEELGFSDFLLKDEKGEYIKDENGYGTFDPDALEVVEQKLYGGANFDKLLEALLADCPYEFYWFDKTMGLKSDISMSGGSKSITCKMNIYFVVAKNFCGSDGYHVDTAVTSAAKATETAAKVIVAKYKDASDYDKLLGYKNEICSLVSYNKTAADTNGYFSATDSNPWQVVYVFDGNASTNVVCEGYAKAFQYLCDLTDFDDASICCYSVTGNMAGGTGAGGHMWNIVTMEDGKNYLVDVTNCDSGAIGNPDKLFMKAPTSGSVSQGYTFALSSDIDFDYDEETLELWGTDSNTILKLADADYAEAAPHECSFAWAEGNQKTAAYHVLSCANCSKTQQEAHTVQSVATCKATAVCTVCGAYGEKDANNHESTEFIYAVNGSDAAKHDKKYACCGAVTETTAHNWIYEAQGSILTAKCQYCPASEELTISAPADLTYNGAAKEAVVANTITNVTPVVVYSSGAAPVDVGTYTASVTLGGQTVSVQYTIAAKTVTPVVTLSPSSYTYDGTAKEPTVTVTVDGVVLGLHEYASQYHNNTNAGTAKVIVYPASNVNYTFEMAEATFTIAPAVLTNDMVSLSVGSMVYTGSALTPEATVTGLTKDTDYTVVYSNNTNVGTATVTVTGMGNYTGTVEKTFEITNHGHVWNYSASGNVITAACTGTGECGANNTATVTLTGGTYTYDGTKKQAAVTQNPAGVFGDIAVNYDADPVNAGSYTASITLGGVTATDTLMIQPKAVTPTLTVETPTYTYDGTEKMPYVSVKDGDVELDPIEYMVFYEDNMNAGTAKTIVKDAAGGNYVLADVDADFTILPAALTDDMVSLNVSSMVYTGSALEPDVAVTGLTKDTDYTVTYSNNVNAGTATVTVEGKGNYAGTVKKTFEITGHVHTWNYSVSGNVITAECTGEGVCGVTGKKATVTLTGGTYTYDGTKKQAAVTQNPAGAFDDVAVTYSAEPVNAGSYTASITLGGVTASTEIVIEPKVVEVDFSAVAASYPYTGSEIKPAVTVADGANAVAQSEYTVTYSNNVNVGKAMITVSGVAGGNYTVSGTKEFDIVKAAAPAVQPCEVTILREIDTTGNAVDLAKLLPENRGVTTYSITSSSDNAAVKNFAVSAEGKVTFDTAKSDAASEAVYVIKTVMQNYNDAEITVKIILSDKEQVTITGAAAASGLTYDGTAKTGYTGTPSAAPYTGAFDVVYAGMQADGMAYGPVPQAPVNAGSYTVTISVPGSAVYAGSTTINFEIAKATVTIKASDKTELVGQAMPALSYEVTGLVGDDQLTDEPTITCTPNMNEAGQYPITVSGAKAGANYEIAYQAGTLSVVMGGTESAVAQIVAKELSSVASALLSTPFDTVEKIKAEQTRALIEGNTDYTEENVAHYDVKLQFSLDGGKTWIDASEVNFPFGGVTVRIDYPQGTSKNTHDFIVSHMFTMTSERLGTVAGKTEQPAVKELEDALEFTVTGLSPVSIAWKETPEVQDAADSLPKTGDASTIFIWTLLCFAALIGSSLASSRREY